MPGTLQARLASRLVFEGIERENMSMFSFEMVGSLKGGNPAFARIPGITEETRLAASPLRVAPTQVTDQALGTR